MNDEDSAQKWKPASIEEVKEILQENLAACDREQRAAFDRDAVEPYFANRSLWQTREHNRRRS